MSFPGGVFGGVEFLDVSATSGNITCNAGAGIVAIPAAASSIVVTNSRVGANTLVLVHLMTAAAGIAIVICSAQTVGSFTLTSLSISGGLNLSTKVAKVLFILLNF